MRTLREIKKIYENKEANVKEVVESYLEKIKEWEPYINAFLHIPYEDIEKQIKELEISKSSFVWYSYRY